ncbi:hypothetical protein DFH09DRAFT_1149694, partial [Mycena vulgaris]
SRASVGGGMPGRRVSGEVSVPRIRLVPVSMSYLGVLDGKRNGKRRREDASVSRCWGDEASAGGNLVWPGPTDPRLSIPTRDNFLPCAARARFVFSIGDSMGGGDESCWRALDAGATRHRREGAWCDLVPRTDVYPSGDATPLAVAGAHRFQSPGGVAISTGGGVEGDDRWAEWRMRLASSGTMEYLLYGGMREGVRKERREGACARRQRKDWKGESVFIGMW